MSVLPPLPCTPILPVGLSPQTPKIGVKMNSAFTIRDEIGGRGLGDLYLGDWGTGLLGGEGGFRENEAEPIVFGVYAKMAEVMEL